MSAVLTFSESGSVEYTWQGDLHGTWFTSKEKGVKRGDTRFIKGKLFYATTIRKSWLSVRVCWSIAKPDGELIQSELEAFRNKIVKDC